MIVQKTRKHITMPTKILCPKCDASLNLPDNAIGKTVKCSKCFAAFRCPTGHGGASCLSPESKRNAPPTFFVRHQGKIYGPIGVAKMKALTAEGKITGGMAISSDRKNWRFAADIKGLLPEREGDEVLELASGEIAGRQRHVAPMAMPVKDSSCIDLELDDSYVPRRKPTRRIRREVPPRRTGFKILLGLVIIFPIAFLALLLATGDTEGLTALSPFLGVGICVLYILPSLIAYYRLHPERVIILMLNAFLGWTLIAWVIGLLYSLQVISGRSALLVGFLSGGFRRHKW